MKRIFFTAFCQVSLFLYPVVLFGQVNIYPAHLGQISLAKGLINPSLQSTQGKIDLTSANQQYTGNLSQIRNTYLIATIGFPGHDTSLLHQRFGIKFLQENEGEFISRPKFYLTYLWSRKLSNNIRLGASTNIGRANYTYQATKVSNTVTSGNWDGDIGVSLTGENYKIAVSINQIFNSEISPLNIRLRWKRFYSFYLEKSLHISQESEVKAYLQSSFLNSLEERIDAGIQMLLSKKVLLGANYYVNNSLSITAGLSSISYNRHHGAILFTYTTPAGNQALANVQIFELGLQYYLKK